MAPIIPLVLGAVGAPSIIGTIASAGMSLFGGGGSRPSYQYPQQVIMPTPPAPVVVAPQKVLPSLTQSQAASVAKTSADQQSQFADSELQGILQRAKEQGVNTASSAAASGEFKDWLAQDQSNRAQLLDLSAQVEQNKADYANQVNQQNFQTQIQAMTQYPNVRPQVVYPQGYVDPGSNLLNKAGGLVGSLLGGGGGMTINPNITINASGIDPATGQPAPQQPYVPSMIDPNTGMPYPSTSTGNVIYPNNGGLLDTNPFGSMTDTSYTAQSTAAVPDTFGLMSDGGGD